MAQATGGQGSHVSISTIPVVPVPQSRHALEPHGKCVAVRCNSFHLAINATIDLHVLLLHDD